MRATHQLRYAIYGIFDLAYNGGARPVRVQEIGDRQGIPARYLEQIFQRLRRAGLVESKRGPGGGYSLARPPDEIPLSEVVVAVEGALLESLPGDGRPPAECPEFVWELIRGSLEAALEPITVGSLCREALRRGLERADSDPAMYEI
jgi:Rrf2 family iron-sulfur cluster assembly transcriptional regulator